MIKIIGFVPNQYISNVLVCFSTGKPSPTDSGIKTFSVSEILSFTAKTKPEIYKIEGFKPFKSYVKTAADNHDYELLQKALNTVF